MDKLINGLNLPKSVIARSILQNFAYNLTKAAVDTGLTYDIKTGNAKITKNEAATKVASLPKKPDPSVYEVRPNGVYPTEIIVDKDTKSYQSPKANP